MFLLSRRKKLVRITGASLHQGKTILNVVDRDGNHSRRVVDNGSVPVEAMRDKAWVKAPGVPYSEPLVVESVDKYSTLEEIFDKVNSALGPYGVRIHAAGADEVNLRTCYFHAERVNEE